MTNRYDDAANTDKSRSDILNSIRNIRNINPQDLPTSPPGIGEESDWDFTTFCDGEFLYSATSNEYIPWHDRLNKYLSRPGYSKVMVVSGVRYDMPEDDPNRARDYNISGRMLRDL